MPREQTSAEVVEVRKHSSPYFALLLKTSSQLALAQAGQFVMVQVGDRLDPYLRRPFSVFDVSREGSAALVVLLGKVVGRGTRRLARCRPGDRLEILGPLGRPFRPPPGHPVALVAGGIGSAALLLLARGLARDGVTFDFYYGGASARDLVHGDDFEALAKGSGGAFIATTEDGTAGRRGRITEPLEPSLAAHRYQHVYSCGPMGLLARLAALTQEHSVSGEAALETPMGCGFGACLGCAVPHRSGRFALCCTEGPVFPLDQVIWS